MTHRKIQDVARGEPVGHVRLVLPGWLPAGLNGPDGLIRRHWRRRRSDKEAIKLRVLASNSATFDLHPVRIPCRVTWIRRYCGNPMDYVNAAASYKHLEDCIVELGILPDDSPKEIAEFVVRQERVASRDEIGCEVWFDAVEAKSP